MGSGTGFKKRDSGRGSMKTSWKTQDLSRTNLKKIYEREASKEGEVLRRVADPRSPWKPKVTQEMSDPRVGEEEAAAELRTEGLPSTLRGSGGLACAAIRGQIPHAQGQAFGRKGWPAS